MGDYTHIRYETPAPHVARVVLDRPEVANALHRELMEELEHAVRRIERDPDVHVWLLTGSPRPDGRPCFSSGLDLKAAAATTGRPRGDIVTDLIDELLTPSIAVVDGVCTTGALELVLACDLRIAADTAEFSDRHMPHFGLALGGWGGPARLTRLVGQDLAKEVFLLSPALSGARAERIGLVNRCVPGAELADTAVGMARHIAGLHPEGVRTMMGYFAVEGDLGKQEAVRWSRLAARFPAFRGRPRAEVAARFTRGSFGRGEPGDDEA
ncbi:enoyl-CoA hydratase/isomerase family protein [Pseudonocardia sp. NPDC049154]|uniref:enoyl-CoA hydratase/isomerase family protein n=1 Tax=Pseudonocardia sp. NPDC049154 TaxID=3155501 RepID=UPI00340BBA0B